MKICLSVVLLSASILSAQTPNLSGVWKLNAEKSKVNGPAPTNYLMIVEQKDSKLTESIGVFGPRGEQRSSLTLNTDGKPSMNSSQGLPMRSTSSMEGSTLVVQSKIAGPRPASMVQKYTLSADGNTLTMEEVRTANGKDTPQTFVFEKQPDAAGEPLRKPEQIAAERFKNVTVMKDVPASRFLDSMRSFTVALGVGCDHCHVQGNFVADDKPAKAMARRMYTMTHGINEQTFAGKQEVRCYTCHQGHVNQQSTPSFE